jgi:HAMP domain-containing protein
MIETLSTFGDQVTNMAREVGIEGRLGGQARVPGAAGLWRDLTDNVNQLAANLTNQVRSIADVATAVTKGDLTRSIAVEASGEMAALKDTINEMIRNLKEQTLKNAEQDWLKTNLARFSRMLQGERDLTTVSNLIMSELAPLVNAQYGVFYVTKREEDETVLELAASYGAESKDELKPVFKLREGLVGQAAADKRAMLLKNVPGNFIRIGSGLGHAAPANINILPALFEDDVKAVIELASFHEFNETHQSFLDQLMESVGIVLNTIAATMRTEGLLKQSQLLTQELQARQTELTTKQEELHATNEELQEKGPAAGEREEAGRSQEPRNRHGSPGDRGKGRAACAHLQVQVRVPGEYEPRTSHAAQLAADPVQAAGRQSARQSQREADGVRPHHPLGRVGSVEPDQRHSRSVQDRVGHGVDRAWRHDNVDASPAHGADLPSACSDKGLVFQVDFDAKLPSSIRTDEKRLQQVVLNLLSNAFKFTAQGSVTFRSAPQPAGWSTNHPCCAAPTGRSRSRSPIPASAFPRQAEAHLRSVPAGRRHHQPQIWRHRPWPFDQPRDRAAARRRVAGPLQAG